MKIFGRSSIKFFLRSSVDLKKILDEDLPKISKRFELKIFQRSQKDFGKKLLEDLPKNINVDL